MYAIVSIHKFNKFYYSKLFKRMRSVLVIAEHNNEILNPITQETITAARKIGGDLSILVAGHECSAIARIVSTVKGLKKVLIAENAAFNGFLAENLTPLILTVQERFNFTHILAGATIFGKTILPRVAGKLNVSAVTDVIDIKDFNVFVRPIYTGHIYITLKTKDPINIVTIKPTHFEACALSESRKLHGKLTVVVRAMNLNKISPKNKYEIIKYQRLKQAVESLKKWQSLRAPIQKVPTEEYNTNLTIILKKDFISKSKLEEAAIVVCGGKGMESAQNFEMLYNFAQNINAAVGASKGAVDEGFAPNNILIGNNGKVVAPNLYIAIGVSGTAQHLTAIKDSKTIVAINKDPSAPIFKIANYGLIADLFKIVPELHNKLKPEIKPQQLNFSRYVQNSYFNVI